MCEYQGYDFGASYPDSTCIDGELWDLDRFEDGFLVGGGQMPCPQCRGSKYVRYFQDNIEDEGYSSLDKSYPKPKNYPSFKHIPVERRRLTKRLWWRGRRHRVKEELKLG